MRLLSGSVRKEGRGFSEAIGRYTIRRGAMRLLSVSVRKEGTGFIEAIG
jgi:hypothetical protein